MTADNVIRGPWYEAHVAPDPKPRAAAVKLTSDRDKIRAAVLRRSEWARTHTDYDFTDIYDRKIPGGRTLRVYVQYGYNGRITRVLYGSAKLPGNAWLDRSITVRKRETVLEILNGAIPKGVM